MNIRKFALAAAAAALLTVPAFSQDVPAWVKKLNISGDVSLRTEFDTGEKNDRDRVRERGRFRLGLDTTLTDKVKGAVGIETAGTNPTSGWVDFTDFTKASLFLSHAYIQYVPVKEFTVSAGVLKSDIPYWKPVQLVWKTDVNPYGIAANIKTGSDKVSFITNAAVMALTSHIDNWNPEATDTPMSSIFVIQPGIEAKAGKNTSLKATFAIQHYGLENHSTSGWLGANKSFTLINPAWEITFANLAANKYGFTFNGEYSRNTGDGFNNWGSFVETKEEGEKTAYMIQAGFGSARIRAAKEWQVKAAYRYMEQNAIPRGMGQTSAYEAQPGKGWEFFFGLGLIRDLAFNATIYKMTDIDGNRSQTVSQFDLIYRF